MYRENPGFEAQYTAEADRLLAGTQRITGTPIKLSETPGSPDGAAPLLGQDTTAVLKELLAANGETIAELEQAGVIPCQA